MSGVPGDSVGETGRAERRRPLTAMQRAVCAPLGFLWLFVLVLVAVPTLAYMTVLYWTVAGFRAIRPVRRRNRSGGEEGRATEERVA